MTQITVPCDDCGKDIIVDDNRYGGFAMCSECYSKQ